MKTLKLIVFIVAVSFVSSLSALANEPSVRPDKYQKDNALIREDIAAINLQKAQIQRLKERCKSERVASDEQALIITKRDLAKKKADLRRSKAYLAADKKDLKRDYQLSFRNYRDEISKDQANLNKYKKQLDKDIANGNEAAISSTAGKIAYYQNKLKTDRALLNKEQNSLDSDLAAIDNELNKKSPERNVAVVNTKNKNETAYSRTNGKYYK